MDSEKKLLDQCIQGSPEAWQSFVKQYSPLVYYIIGKVLRSKCPEAARDELSDLHNDVFLSLMDKNGRKLQQYEGKNGCSVSTWIRVIAIRATIDYCKKRRNALSLSDEDTGREAEQKTTSAITPLHMLEEEENKRFARELIEELSPGDRLFIRLFYYEEVSPAELAKIFKSTPNAIYSRGNYLREKLKKSIEKKVSKKKT